MVDAVSGRISDELVRRISEVPLIKKVGINNRDNPLEFAITELPGVFVFKQGRTREAAWRPGEKRGDSQVADRIKIEDEYLLEIWAAENDEGGSVWSELSDAVIGAVEAQPFLNNGVWRVICGLIRSVKDSKGVRRELEVTLTYYQ